MKNLSLSNPLELAKFIRDSLGITSDILNPRHEKFARAYYNACKELNADPKDPQYLFWYMKVKNGDIITEDTPDNPPTWSTELDKTLSDLMCFINDKDSKTLAQYL